MPLFLYFLFVTTHHISLGLADFHGRVPRKETTHQSSGVGKLANDLRPAASHGPLPEPIGGRIWLLGELVVGAAIA